MPIDFTGVIVAGILWLVAVVVTFIYLNDRFRRKNDPDPPFRAALYTAVWSVPYGIAGLVIAFLYDLFTVGF